MAQRILCVCVSLILYALWFIGLFIIFENSFKYLKGRFSLRHRLRAKSPFKLYENKIISKASRLVLAATGKDKGGSCLVALTMLLFTVSFAAAHKFFSISLSMVMALLCASVPIGSLVSNMQKNRNRSSKEGMVFVSEFFRQYRINSRSIYSAMEETARENTSYPICSKQLYLLLLHLRQAGSRIEIKRCCDDFAFSLGTLWGKTLASCIFAACDGDDITEALADIMARLRLAERDFEERKRLNSEAVRMTVYLVPILYLGTIFLSVKFLGLGWGNFFKNQFGTPEGFLLFFISFFMFFLNTVILNSITNAKVDY